MPSPKFTDEEMQAVMSVVRDARNHHDDTARMYDSKWNTPIGSAPYNQEAREFYRAQSKLLTSAMVKIYEAIDASD